MAEITNEPMYEILRRIQANLALLKDDMRDIKARLTSIDGRLGIVHTDMAGQSSRIDRLEVRIERIERRLELTNGT